MPSAKASKALQKRSDQALDAFQKYYADLWGDERWHDSLFPSLVKPTRYCALINRYASVPNAEALLRAEGEHDCEVLELETSQASTKTPLVFVKTSSDTPFPPPMFMTSADGGSRLSSHWNMDAASVLAAYSLGVKPGDKVLDLCAAPGGKSIALAQMLWPDLHADKTLPSEPKDHQDQAKSVLHVNEFDRMRNARLDSNLKSYLPQILLTDNLVKVLRIDASEKFAALDLPFGEGGYDKVLLDAPCSSERHIVHAYMKANAGGRVAEEMSNWKSSHSKTLAKTQVSLLLTALKAVKVGGSVLYATCSISQEENDDVVDRVFEALKRDRKKFSSTSSNWKVKVERKTESSIDNITESTKHGKIALPDHAAGGRWGPLYFCVLKKVPCDNKVTMEEAPATK